jgi:hypothetical protein
MREIGYALRRLRGCPTFTIAATLTLAIAIAATAAVFDRISYVAGAALLGVGAAVACAIPAWRAVQVDPMAMLRGE